MNIIGVGGIGSPIAETLARMGFDLRIWDHDTVSPENVGSQRYGFPDIERPKVDVLKERLETAYQITVEANACKYEGQEVLEGIVVSGVDSLETRAMIWEHMKFNPAVTLFIDGRVGGTRFKVFALNPCGDLDRAEKYESRLDLTASRTELQCTSKFAPQAGSALDWCITSLIISHIGKGTVPFAVIGEDFMLQVTQD
ncbi:ThiF family adenylyltransferase [Patescibacteria group bacterium]